MAGPVQHGGRGTLGAGGGLRAFVGWIGFVLGRHFGAVTTFGLAWWSLVLFPGAVLFLLPMGVAGAARLVVEADGVPRGSGQAGRNTSR